MQSLSLTQQQTLQARLSPSQIQVVRLLELPTIELQKRITEELQDNPALEEGRSKEDIEKDLQAAEGQDYTSEEAYDNPLQNEDFNYDTYVNDDEVPDYSLNNSGYTSESSERPDITVIGSTTLLEHLKSQVYLTNMSKEQRHIAKWVLGNIDDDGYLRRTTEQLVDDLSFQEGIIISEEEMDDIVSQIKHFDPAGIASSDLRECLLNQLTQKHPNENVQTAIRVLSKCFEDFSKHRYDSVCETLNISQDELRSAINEIKHLNQKPANAFTGNIYENSQTTIIPDFNIENKDGELILSLNTGDIPDLHVSEDYQAMLQGYDKQSKPTNADKEAIRFLKQKIESANWFIDAIKQRNETLYRTMAAILTFQKEFFLEGDDIYIKPMILQDIADRTGYDVSTISRVSNSKYVQTEFGVYPLKHFFSESMTNEDGEEVSTREIKTILYEAVQNEDKHNPLSDEKLVELMKQKGYIIARRTITKYREQLNIPIARLRRGM